MIRSNVIAHKNMVNRAVHFQEEAVEAVDLRRWEQVGLQLFPENHDRGAITDVERQRVPETWSISMERHVTISLGGSRIMK